jgi:hypothetical protein
MRTSIALMSAVLSLSPVQAHPFVESRTREVRPAVVPSQFEAFMEELRAVEAHTDHYLVMRLEIEALRRDNPEHREFLDRYLASQLPR